MSQLIGYDDHPASSPVHKTEREDCTHLIRPFDTIRLEHISE